MSDYTDSTIKYFKELTLGEIAERADKANKECTYIELVAAIKSLEGKVHDRENLIKVYRRTAAKTERGRTDFENIFVFIVSAYLEAEIVNQGK